MNILKTTIIDFIDDKCPTMAAALAYYTLFALPSLLLVIISVAGLVFGYRQVESRIQSEIQALVGQSAGAQVGTMVQHAGGSSSTVVGTALGLLALAYSATTSFAQLQSSLNTIWRVEPDPNKSGVVYFFKTRLLSFFMVIGIAILFLAFLALGTAISGAGAIATNWLPSEISQAALHGIEAAVSFIVFTFLFGALFKVLPDANLNWKQVRAGAIATAILFTVGKFLISVYLGHSGAASAYGAAGSLVLIVLWVYYSAMILLLGAEFTRVWPQRRVGAIQPVRGAIHTDRSQPAH